MLKKLFISLIILSTLTSDGIVNIPWKIYDLYLEANSRYVKNDSNSVIELMKETQAAQIPLCSEVASHEFALLRTEGIGWITYNREGNVDYEINSPHSYYISNEVYFDNILSNAFLSLVTDNCFSVDKNVILNQSDVSPPLV